MVTLVIYFAAVIGIGVWTSKKMAGTEGYFVGGRSIPGWAVGISMLGTAISSITFLAYPGTAYSSNWSLLVPGLTVPIGALFAIYLFVPYYRRANLVSVNQYLEMRFAPWARAYGCIMWSMFSFIRMGIILFLLSLPIKTMTGFDTFGIIVVLGILVTAYTVMGGIEAVIWTDVVQTLVLLFGGLICVATVWAEVPGGMAAILSDAIEGEKFYMSIDSDFSLVRETLWVLLLYGLFQNLQEFASDQTKVQRYCAANSGRAARLSVWVGGIGCIPVWMLFMFVGTCMWVFYHYFPQQLPEGILSDEVFPYFILNELPVGVAGFLIAAVIAAAMSSIDSSMNGTATVLTTDIYKRFLVKDRDDAHYLMWARWITAAAGAGMIAFSLTVAYIVEHDILQKDTILGIAFFFFSLFAGGIGGMFFLGFFSTRVNSQGLAIGVVLAVLVSAYMAFGEFKILPEAWSSPLHRYMINVCSNTICFVIGYFCSFLFAPPPRDQLTNLTVWTDESAA